jgi:hypothetical protein
VQIALHAHDERNKRQTSSEQPPSRGHIETREREREREKETREERREKREALLAHIRVV